jgi:O-antigen/teichoic acid export membrane protein
MYTVAFQIASILYVVAVALNKAFSPYLYKKLNDITNEEKIKLIRYSYGYFLLLLIGAFILSGISPFIVNYFLGSKFVEAQQYITFLSFSFAFQGMYLMVVNYVLYMKKTALLSYVTITISIIHILLSYILITQYGLMGAAQATLITSILTFFSVWILSYKVYKMPWLSVFARDHRSE